MGTIGEEDLGDAGRLEKLSTDGVTGVLAGRGAGSIGRTGNDLIPRSGVRFLPSTSC